MLQEDDVEWFMTIARSDYIERKQDQRLKKQIAQNERITDLSSKLDVWAGNL